jgi:Coenzyme PQQ synthesis protein D (PqqD)
MSSDRIVFRANDDGGMLLDTAAGLMFGLTPVAAVAWPALRSGGGLDAAVEAVLEHFDVDEATARTNLEQFITTLHEHGLLDQTS